MPASKSAVARPLLVERHQRGDFVRRSRAAGTRGARPWPRSSSRIRLRSPRSQASFGGPPRSLGEPGAFDRRAGGHAHEDAPTARRIAGTRRFEGTGDDDGSDAARCSERRVDPEVGGLLVDPGASTRSTIAAPIVCGPALTGTRKLRTLAGFNCSPSSVTSICAETARRQRPPPVTPNSYSASSGKVWRTSRPPRVPSGSPSMCSSCTRPPGAG